LSIKSRNWLAQLLKKHHKPCQLEAEQLNSLFE
jgi:hypothetical protein